MDKLTLEDIRKKRQYIEDLKMQKLLLAIGQDIIREAKRDYYQAKEFDQAFHDMKFIRSYEESD